MGFATTGGITADRVLVFFSEASRVAVEFTSVPWTLWATDAVISTSNALLEGKAVGLRYVGVSDVGLGEFNGDVSGCTSDDPIVSPVACSYTWDVVNSWTTGAQVEVEVQLFLEPLTSWEVIWEFDHAETVQNLWNGSFTQGTATFGNDSEVVVTDAGWNGSVATDGTISFGMGLDTPVDVATENLFRMEGANCMPVP